MAALASDWLRHFFTSHLKLLNGIPRNMTGSKVSTSSAKFVGFLGRSEKTKLPPWPLIGWDIFDFSFETVERHSTKLDRKQDLNVLYQGFFSPIGKQDCCSGLWLVETFLTSPLKLFTEINKTWRKESSDCPLQSLCFPGRSVYKNGRPVRSV